MTEDLFNFFVLLKINRALENENEITSMLLKKKQVLRFLLISFRNSTFWLLVISNLVVLFC